jgi:hypothetical protein
MDNIKGIKIKGSSDVYGIEATSMKIDNEEIASIISDLKSTAADIDILRGNIATLLAYKSEVENTLAEMRIELEKLGAYDQNDEPGDSNSKDS